MKVVLRDVENKQAMKALRAISPMQVLVGIPDGANSRGATSKGGLTSNATLGYLQETGNPSTNLPARPHLVPGVRAAMPRIERLAAAAIKDQIAGNANAIRDALDMFGLVAVSSVRRKIQSNIPPPLALRTKQNRLYRQRGFINATPSRKAAMMQRWLTRRFTALIDTGQYIQAITYVVRKKP